ncbi:MAG: MFS transporter, partial [Polyangiaceae bacterium]
VSQVAQLPHVIKLLWSPALDSGPRRRTWYLGAVAVAVASLAIAVLMVPDATRRVGPFPLLWVYAAVLFVAQAAAATSGTAVLALMAMTVPAARRGAASGWQTAGNLAGTATGGALVAWMLMHLAPGTTAIVLAFIGLASALPAVFVDEVPPPRRRVSRLIAGLLADVWRTLRSREGWTGMLICLSPVGAGALTNLFSALALDYAPNQRAAEHLVLIVAGLL